MEELRRENISIADVVIERNVPGAEPEDVAFYFVLYPENVNMDVIDPRLQDIIKRSSSKQ